MSQSSYDDGLQASETERMDMLEGLVDSTRGRLTPHSWTPTGAVRQVLDELAGVCGSKDEHVSEQHGSGDPDAREWRKLGRRLDKVVEGLLK